MKFLQRVASVQVEHHPLQYSCWWGDTYGERLAPDDESDFARAASE
jgi:hypothetical protein